MKIPAFAKDTLISRENWEQSNSEKAKPFLGHTGDAIDNGVGTRSPFGTCFVRQRAVEVAIPRPNFTASSAQRRKKMQQIVPVACSLSA